MLRTENDNFNRNLAALITGAAMPIIKSNLFVAGPGVFTYRLGMVDERLQEFKTRAKESNKECLSTTAVKFEPKLPNSEAFPMYFSCKEAMSTELNVYFGQKDDNYYVAELQKGTANSPSIAVLASVDSAGNKVEVWQVMVDATANPKTVSVSHIKADKSANTIQVIDAATMTGTNVGCGIKLSSTASALWVYGDPRDAVSNACGAGITSGDYASSTDSGDYANYCVDPTALTDISAGLANGGACSALKSGFQLAIFRYDQMSGYANDGYDLIFNPQLPAGLVDFKTVKA